LHSWVRTWRLVGLAMPLGIVAITGAAFGLGWPLAVAALLGAALAPTDPVLASDVQVGKPSRTRDEDEVRFSLTSEAGLNDGLAFPFVYAAIALAGTSGAWWVPDWALVNVGYRIAVGVRLGWTLGRGFALLFCRHRAPSWVGWSEHADGFVSLTAPFISYAVTV